MKGENEMKDFEEWWKNHEINRSEITGALKNTFKEVARMGWDAAIFCSGKQYDKIRGYVIKNYLYKGLKDNLSCADILINEIEYLKLERNKE